MWLNDGTGTFTDSGVTLASASCYYGAIGDIDADGDLDVFVAHYGSGGQANTVWTNVPAP